VVEIPGFDAPGSARRFGGVRGSRPGDPARSARRTADGAPGADTVDDEQPALSAVARRHLREGVARLHDVGAFDPITDADNARSVARSLGRLVREHPRDAEAAQAHVTAAAVQRVVG
jgi:hypothetical protein